MKLQAQQVDCVVCREELRGNNVGRHIDLQVQQGNCVLCGEVLRGSYLGRHMEILYVRSGVQRK